MSDRLILHDDRFFDPELRSIAGELYERVRDLPIVSPHGHVDPALFSENAPFPDPARLIITPDHYVFRMLYSQGVPLEALGVPRIDGGTVEQDPKRIWQVFCEHFHLFDGTPSGIWLTHELVEVFGVDEPVNGDTAGSIYDHIDRRLREPDFLPRAMFDRFNIEVLSTTDAAGDTLEHHAAIRESGWGGRIVPCFRPDAVVNIGAHGWRKNIDALAAASGIGIATYRDYIDAIENRRAFFKTMGATSTDHGVVEPWTGRLSDAEAEEVFGRALRGTPKPDDERRFVAHMLMEMARMSIDDGLVMQLHPGSFRNHNESVASRFGPDKGCDIPVATEFTRNLHALLNAYGNDTRLTLIVFTLDETAYSRELAPLAGHYPAMRLGPAWWFHDSIEGMIRYRRATTESAGIYNTVGFNDDTRAFPSIPARHDLSRRIDCNYIAGLVARRIVDIERAHVLCRLLAHDLAADAYKLGDKG